MAESLNNSEEFVMFGWINESSCIFVCLAFHIFLKSHIIRSQGLREGLIVDIMVLVYPQWPPSLAPGNTIIMAQTTLVTSVVIHC